METKDTAFIVARCYKVFVHETSVSCKQLDRKQRESKQKLMTPKWGYTEQWTHFLSAEISQKLLKHFYLEQKW